MTSRPPAGRAASDDAFSEDRRSIAQVVLAVVLVGVALVLVGVQLVLERQRELARAARGVSNIAAAVTEHAAQAIDSVDAELSFIAAAAQDGRDAMRQRLADTLAVVRGSTPLVQEVFVLDAAGRVVAAASPTAPETRTFHDTELFRHHRATPASGVYISDPGIGLVGAARGIPVVRVSRRLSLADGRFDGIVVASLSTEPMRSLYNSLDLGVNGVVTLFRADGLVLVRVPSGGPYGATIASTSFFREQIAGRRSGVFDLTSPLDQVVRVTAFGHDDARRLLVTVGIPRDEVLRDWTQRAVIAAIIATLIVVLLVVTYRQRVKGLRIAERRARDSARRFGFLADASADLARASSTGEILETVAEFACLVVPAAHAAIRVATARDGTLQHQTSSSASAGGRQDDDVLLEVRRTLARDVLETGRSVYLSGTELHARVPAQSHPPNDGTLPNGWLGVPLTDRDGRSIGLLEVFGRLSGDFSTKDQALLEQLARLAAATLETRSLADDMAVTLASAEEARLEAERGRLDLLEVFNTTSDAFLSVDQDWRFTFVNAQGERVLQCRREDLLGRVVWEVFPQTVGTVFEDEVRYASREHTAREFRYFSERIQRWLDMRAFPYEAGLSIYFRDVTEQVALDAQIRQAQKMDAVGQLTGGIAHDFNNLLTVILGSADALIDALPDENLRGLADTTRIAAEKAAELTQRLLAFSRRQPLAPRSVDVTELVGRLESLLRRALGEHIAIQVVAAPDTWPAMVDPSQLENAILNLAINARDAMPAGGRLVIELSNARVDAESAASLPDADAGEYVCIAVTDTGTGMSPEVAARAFEPFFTTKEVGRGSGLGLSMVYGFARQSGGHVVIESANGCGTRLALYLPRSEADSVQPTPPDADEPPAPGGTERVALVEDQDLVRRHTGTVLRSLGYEVTAYPDGPSLLAALDGDLRPEVLVTDVVLPGGMNGREVALAAIERVPGLAVLYMSGYSEDALMHHGRLDEGVELLSKPFRRLDLARKLRLVIDNRRSGRS